MCNLYIDIKHFYSIIKRTRSLASTNAFIPLINILPIAAVPCAIANSGKALLFLQGICLAQFHH